MLSYEEALALVRSRIEPHGRVRRIPLLTAAGRVLAEEVVAEERYPRFDNSSVDGYALPFAAEAGARAPLAGVAPAGQAFEGRFDGAVRVLTGAPIPEGTYGVVMQEDVSRDGDAIVLREAVARNAFVRRAGSDVAKGETLLSPGVRLSAGGVALAASQGLADLAVADAVRCRVVTTGDEVVDFAETPSGAQIRDTNAPMMTLQARSAGCEVEHVRVVDDEDALREALGGDFDLILVAGGASVGDRDFLPGAVARLGEVVFHGVRMRPGKPILFGRIGPAWVFGLPGNPASAFVGFELFVREAVGRLLGCLRPEPRWTEAVFGEDRKAVGREDFARVVLRELDGTPVATPVGEQGSFGLRSLAFADGLARLPADRDVRRGERVPVLLLPAP